MKNIFFFIVFFSLLFCLHACHNTRMGKGTDSEVATAPEVKSIFINGDSIHYIDVGKGDPVVFIHGAVGDYRTHAAQIDTFSNNHHVISYSRRFAYPNNQVINDPASVSVASHAKDLAAFLKALNLGPAHLVGHSYGADIALLVAADHPELVKKLILGEPFIPSLLQKVPGGDTILNNFITNTFAPVGEAFKNNNNEAAVKALINGVMGDTLYYNRLPQEDRDIMLANWQEVKSIFSGKDNFPVITCDDVKKIKTPVLLVRGDRSPPVFLLMIDELNRCLSNREIATLTNTSHGLEYENPAGFNRAVLGFIDKP